jgi:aminopeptidase N
LALDLTEAIQQTGDIFFPLRWLNATLDGHQSAAAADIVQGFLDEHPDYPPRLRGKLLQAADDLFRSARIVAGWGQRDR